MKVAGGERVQLTFFEHASAASPAWSPDGQRIAFISDQNGTPKVWTINANGGTAQLLENTKASDTNTKLSWRPSSHIVYSEPGMQNLLQINDEAKEGIAIIQHDRSFGWAPDRPVFSPDAKKMTVFWNRKNGGLWIISSEPYAETLLNSGDILPFGWSPDGNTCTRSDMKQAQDEKSSRFRSMPRTKLPL